MGLITATVSNWFLIGPISRVLGYIMNWIFEGLNAIGIPNIGLAIIFFTLITKAIMIPLSINQQKFSKLQSVMQPELTAIQNKYKGKQDNASVMAQQEETKEVYAKYGANPVGGCLQTIIQMPILFALYQVIYHMPGHIAKLKEYYTGIANVITGIEGYATNEEFIAIVRKFAANVKVDKIGTDINYVIDVLYKLSHNGWDQLIKVFPQVGDAYSAVATNIDKVNYFLGIDLTMKPTEQITTCWWVVMIPILAGALQWLSAKMMENNQPKTNSNDQQNGAGGMMKSMNVIFPIMSVVFCFMFEAGLGIYWVASSGVQCLIQLVVNNYINKVDINEMVKKNIEKLNKKRAKKGLPPKKIVNVSQEVRTLEAEKELEEEKKKEAAEKAKVSSEFYQSTSTAKKGSLAEKAGMVQQYEERQKSLRGKN